MKKGIYILPSLFTSGNLTCGFLTILYALRGNYILASTLIMVAMVFDSLDGKISRLTGTSSNFGVELDSLADVVSFGLAPAFLVYIWMKEPSQWVVFLMYVLGAALRLARFNVKALEISDPDVYFRGLPTPAAAACLASLVLFFGKHNITLPLVSMLAFMVLLSYLMISHIEYFSFKKLRVEKRTPLKMLWITLILALLVYARFAEMMFLLSFIYLFSGIKKRIFGIKPIKAQIEKKEAITDEKNKNI